MTVHGREMLIDFQVKHPDSADQLNAWYHEALRATWATPAEVRSRYPRASIVRNKKNRMIFRIKHNRYRLLVAINYSKSIVLIEGVWTHAEYNKWLKTSGK